MTTMIGTSERARSSRHTSKPSRSGRPRSSSTTSNGRAVALCRARRRRSRPGRRRGPRARDPWRAGRRWRRRPRRSGLACSSTFCRTGRARLRRVSTVGGAALTGIRSSRHTGFTRCAGRADRAAEDSCGSSSKRESDVERRRLLATAGVLSVTAFAATVGLGANFGLFERDPARLPRRTARLTPGGDRRYGVEPASPPATTVAPRRPHADD